MAGGFSNTRYNDTIQSILGAQVQAINNPHYQWTDKAPTPVTYYNINQSQSTLDSASQLAYDNVGSESPFRYNKINNMLLYGLDNPAAITLSNDEFGLEAAAIEGECIILPNTFIPTVNDRFTISYVKEKKTFNVTHVDPDTLEDGSNIYRLQYRSSSANLDALEQQVVQKFEFIPSNAGTQYQSILRSDIVELIERVSNELLALKKYYKSIFYNSRVQAFTFKHLESNFYDPYFTEFLKSNRILEGDDEYIYIQHQTPLSAMFPLKYNKTFFRALEKKDVTLIEGYPVKGGASLITAPYSIFENRIEDYWEMGYDYPVTDLVKPIQCYRDELVSHITRNKLFIEKFTYYNIIIKYFNDGEIVPEDLDELEKVDYEDNAILFYAIPSIIYCLQKMCQDLLKKDPETYI